MHRLSPSASEGDLKKVKKKISIKSAALEIMKGESTSFNVRILVIAEKFTGSTATQILGKLNYTVTQIESITQAVEILGEPSHDYSLIILYSVLGNSNPIDLIFRLKETCTLPIIVVSSGGGVETIAKYMKAGAHDCLFAPLCKEVVEARIHSILQIISLKGKVKRLKRRGEERRSREEQDIQFQAIAMQQESRRDPNLDDEMRKTVAGLEERLSFANKELSRKDEEIAFLQQQVQALSWKASLLESEKHKGETLSQQLLSKEKEIDYLKKNLSKALETPIQVVTRTLTQLVQGNLDQKELKISLTSLIQSISSSTQLYQPALTKVQFLNSLNLDEMTRKWLLSEFTRPVVQTVPVPAPTNLVPSSSIGNVNNYMTNSLTLTSTNNSNGSNGINTSNGSTTAALSPRAVASSRSTSPRPFPNSSLTASLSPGFSTYMRGGAEPIPFRINDVAAVKPQLIDPSRTLQSGRNVDDILARGKTTDLTIINTWHCNVWLHEAEEIYLLTWTIFQDLGLVDKFQIPVVVFFQFMETLQESYLGNSYHNFHHAFDVAQTCYLFVKSSNVRQYLTAMDILAMIIGALCHDIDHPGLNNVYQVNTRSPLSLLYNDLSVLENHHCSRAFYYLGQESTNILCGLSPVDYKEFRRTVVSAILATDMTTHFELLTRFTTHLEARPFSIENKDDRQLIVDILLHSADISNPCKPYNISKRWADLLLEEFLAQGDLEREGGIAVSPFMDRNTTDQVRMTLNFMDYMVAPLFTSLAKLFSGMRPLLEYLQINRAQWADKTYEPPKIQIHEPHKDGSSNGNNNSNGNGNGLNGSGGSNNSGSSLAINVNGSNGVANTNHGLGKTKKRSYSSPPSAYMLLNSGVGAGSGKVATRSPSTELKRMNLEGKISPPDTKGKVVLPKLT